MRLSTVLELLLIFLFLAFAASRTVHPKKGKQDVGASSQNRYCQCSQLMCNCCRDFSFPVVSLKGPGCARVSYLNEESMRLTMTFGDRVLRNITLTGKRPKPVCMPLPGGVSKFCGRIYGITRDGDHFKACLALELRSLEDLEAALRVSCFRFGPEGVKLEPGKPVPVDEEEDEDDDYGLADDDDDDDDDDIDLGLGDDDDDDEENDVEGGDADYTGFSALSDEFLSGFFSGESSSTNKNKPTTTAPPTPKPTKKPSKKVKPTTSKTSSVVTTPVPQETTKADIAPTVKTTEESDNKSEDSGIITSTETGVQETDSADNMPSAEATPSSVTEEEQHTENQEEEEDDEEDEDDDTNDTDSGISIIKKEEDESNNVLLAGNEESPMRHERLNLAIHPEGRGENLTPEETEKLFPGLTGLIRPPSYTAYSFPPSRSARTHRRMRLPPIDYRNPSVVLA